MFYIQYDTMCDCCGKKASRKEEYESYEDMNSHRMYLLQEMEESEDIYFASLQTFIQSKLLCCYYVSGSTVMIVDNNGEWMCNKLKEVA